MRTGTGSTHTDTIAIFAGLMIGLAVSGCGDPSPGPASVVIDDESSSDAWRTIAAGTYNSCAIGPGAAAYCWGFALVSECTDAGCAVNSTPARVEGHPTSFDTVASGGGFHCGIAPDRTAWCWGSGLTGSLGDGVTQRSSTPVRVAVDGPIKAVATGYSSTCVLTEAGVVWCWGWKLGAQPTDPVDERIRALPQMLETELRFVSISIGLSACALTAEGAGYCWGGGYGVLGAGDRDTVCSFSESCLITAHPVPIEGSLRWKSLSVGTVSACGVTTDDRGYCWGEVRIRDDPNPHLGLLGTGRFEGSKSPVPVAGDVRFRQIVVGTRQACGIATDGSGWCWGNNEGGELGIGSLGGRFALPREIVGGLEFTSLALADHSCGLTVNRNLYCWGITYGGALGIGVAGPGVRTVPTRVRPPGA